MGVAPADSKDVRKKKRPPTFQHLPKNRAAKLKKAWVEKNKLKSRWKAQKRKEGLVTPSVAGLAGSPSAPTGKAQARGGALEALDSHEEAETQDDSENSSEGSQLGSGDDSDEEYDEAELVSVSRSGLRGSDSEHWESEDEGDSPDIPKPVKKKVRIAFDEARRSSKDKTSDKSKRNQKSSVRVTEQSNANTELDKPSLRELERMAYSRSSLHSYKSDPLHKRKISSGPARGNGRNAQSTRGGGPARGGRSGDRGGFGARGGMTGRGQPNMKLRMNAMLERIKRDYT